MSKGFLRFAALFVCAVPMAPMVWAEESPNELPFVEGGTPPSPTDAFAWCLVTKPAAYKSRTERVMTQPASFYYEVIPAKFELIEETIQVQGEQKIAAIVPAEYKTEKITTLIKEESSRLEVVPAQYELVDEVITVVPEGEREEVVPAVYKTETQQFLVQDAHVEWVECDCSDEGAKITRAETKDKCYKLVQVPATYKTITKTVLAEEAKTIKTKIPAVTKTIKVQKVVKPAQTVSVKVPAEYAEVEKQVIVKPSSVTYTTIPARSETVKKMKQVEPESKRKIELPAKYEEITCQALERRAERVWRKAALPTGARKTKVEKIVEKFGSLPGRAD